MDDNPFLQWLPDVTSDAVVVRPDDIDAEARGNLWSITLSSVQVRSVTVGDVVDFVQRVVVARSEWLAIRSLPSMLFYCWHDEQAGQLRLSLVSAAHGRLPFGSPTHAATDLAAIAQEFLRSPHLPGIPWSQLNSVEPLDFRLDLPEPTLQVWLATIP